MNSTYIVQFTDCANSSNVHTFISCASPLSFASFIFESDADRAVV